MFVVAVDAPGDVNALRLLGRMIVLQDDLAEWQPALQAVQQRAMALMMGFKEWSKEHSGSKRVFPDLPYVMLHSFAHLLITALSLGCGYPSSSIRERVCTATCTELHVTAVY